MNKKNRGFTLVELLVAMAVIAIVGTMVVSFLMVSTRTYGKAVKEADMQEDAQIVLAQLYNYVVDTDASLRYFVDTVETGPGTEVLCDDQYTGGTTDFATKRLEIYKNAESGMTLETIFWQKSAETITYKREKIDSAGNKVSDVLEQALATNVTYFAADLTDVESKNQVKMAVSLLITGREYEAQNTVNLRNKVVVNEMPEGFVPPVLESTVTSVKVVPQISEIEKNGRKTFQAVVYGTNSPSQEVTWSVEGNTSALTTIEASGRLWVGSDEKARELTVRATSVQDSTKSGTGLVSVKLKYQDKLTLGTIRDYYTYTYMKVFLYARVNGELTGDVNWNIESIDGATGATLEQIPAFHAAKISTGYRVGTYRITISGRVDGNDYTDSVVIHVKDASDNGHISGNFSFVGANEYWVKAGESITVATMLNNFYGSDSQKRRYWSDESSEARELAYSVTTSGTLEEAATIQVADTSEEGEIHLRATINPDGWYNYAEITIHVYTDYDFPYLIETTSLKKAENLFNWRLTPRGPVHIVDSTAQLTDLSVGIMSLMTDYEELTETSYYSSTAFDNGPKSNKWYINTTSGAGCTIGAESKITVPEIIVSENDLNFSCNDITSGKDLIIYIKGNHKLYVNWGSFYFDGIIYAPEGTVEIETNEGFVRGVIIAKEVKIVNDYGNGAFSIMEKKSVMNLVNELRAK